jgi:hypothetical protein
VRLDEVLSLLNGLPPEQQQTVNEAVAGITASMKWLPSPGPQTDAFWHPADVLLYGGQGGGGKSDLGLGLAFTQHKRSLILRRKYTNLDALIERAIEVNGTRDGFNGSPPPKLRTNDGRLITFGANQHLGDEQGFQGQPFDFKCVGAGTLVLMPDGAYRAIETLQVGEFVQTLEGARRINRVFPVRSDEAIRLTVWDEAGEPVCYQDQSLTHEVLTPEGWACHDTFGGSSRLSTYEPMGCCEEGTTSRRFFRPSRVRGTLRAARHWGQQQVRGALRGCLARAGLTAGDACVALPHQGIAFAASCGSHRGLPPLRGWSSPEGRTAPRRGSDAGSTWQHTSGFRAGDARFWSALQGWMGGCWSAFRQCGGRVLKALDRCCALTVARSYLLQQDGAGRPIPICSANDGRGQTPKHSPRTGTYAHPYTREIRSVSQGSLGSGRTFSTSRIGVIQLYDIEVDEVNHFITAGDVINKNCFDEAVQFLEAQVRFHLGWLRSTEPGQRVRALLATNPPVNAEGDWIVGMFRPWLDVTYPKPAKPGEMRWFVTAPDGSDVEVDGPGMVQLPGMREPVQPLSRSFIPARLADNPYLVDTGYAAKLDALPEPLRSAVRDGNFMAARQDAEFQVIPASWVIAAQERWTPRPPEGVAMTAMGFDPAGGGSDSAALCWRYGGWYSEIVEKNGEETADGSRMAAIILTHRRDVSPVVVDMGGGFGGSVTQRLRDNGCAFVGYNGAHKSTGQTVGASKLGFYNKRAEVWWRFREALDPDQEGGSAIALPPDPELRAELTAPTWELTTRGILVEDKAELRKRLGRSTNKADCVTIALSEGATAQKKMMRRDTMPATANVGFANVKRVYGRR